MPERSGAPSAQALREHLAQGGQYAPRFVDVPLRVGELSPNFLFEGAPQQPLTLRKLKGRRMVLIFSPHRLGPQPSSGRGHPPAVSSAGG